MAMCLVLVLILISPKVSIQGQYVDVKIANPFCQDNRTGPGVSCFNNARNSEGHIQLSSNKTAAANDSGTGYVFFRDSVQMLVDSHDSQVVSFSTSFTFVLTPIPNVSTGDGFSFVMFANSSFRGHSGGALGVYLKNGTAGTRTFCVEFDTFLNNGLDPSDNHVGVDTKTYHSEILAEADTVGIKLADGYAITSWIDYDSSQSVLEIRIAKDSNARPANALITHYRNLSDVLEKFMSVGFAASVGGSKEFCQLNEWNFSTFHPALQTNLSKSHGHNSDLIWGVPVGAVSALLLVGLGYCSWMRWARLIDIFPNTRGQDNVQLASSILVPVDTPLRFSYNELSEATNGFSEDSKLGQGGSSSVHKGMIASMGRWVAVKRVAQNAKQREKQFLAEIKVVSLLRHRNLVKILGWCSEEGNLLLVYELMPNGSLDKLLYEEDNRTGDFVCLSWSRRLAIMREVAAGLAYLHDGHSQPVIHRDVKSSNVMLDEDFNARVGDFGLARLTEHSQNLPTTQLAGTFGYTAPEAVSTWKSNDKTDIYAFGVLMLEVASARRPIHHSSPLDTDLNNLVEWVWDLHTQGNILGAADPRLRGKFPETQMTNVLLIGLLCCNPDPDTRPSMQQLQYCLTGDVTVLPRQRQLNDMMQGLRAPENSETLTDGEESSMSTPMISSKLSEMSHAYK